MGFSEFWIQRNNSGKEQLGDTKHGIRREQIDKKYQNLFDVYDTNQDGTLENEELNVLLKGLKTFAGNDKVLDTNENKMLSSIFAKEIQIENADFQGFVEAISDAAGAIVSTEETMGEDGGKVITTEYDNGLVETLYYYPDGEFKMKKVLHDSENTTYTLNGKSYSKKQLDAIIKNAYDKFCSAQTDSISFTTYEGFAHDFIEKYNVCPHTQKYHREDLEMSDRAKQDASVRDFILNHFIETHKLTRESLDTMGILDDIGAAVNAGGGELWNACKNIYNKYFGDGSESDYQNFYELVKKFEPEYNKALVAEGNLETMRNNPELYLEGFKQRTGMDFNSAQGIKFLKVTEQYQNAQILKERLSILNKALSEIRMYQSAQDAITYAPVQSEGINPADHILKANELLLQYFGGDKEAAELVLSGTIGNPERTMETINGLIEDTKKLNSEVLNGKSFDEVKNDYINQYKEIYNTDFVPDELTEKVMDAKATGGMVKIAAITLISIIITRSPAMAGILRASAGTAVDGAAANVIRTLVSKYGQTTVQQGIKLAMSSGTVATDVGLTLLNQVTSERGINGEELWETTKNAAKYIYFGTYIGGPIAQAVSSRLGKIGLTGKLFAGGTKTTQGAVTTTTVTGDKLVENFMKSSKSILAQGGAMASEIASFSLLDLATGADDIAMVVEEQGKMLPAIKIMHNLFEYMLGAKAHTAVSKANFEAAIERSGIKDWTIKETKTPSGVTYSVDMKGIPLGTFKDVNTLATAMFERVAKAYSESDIKEKESAETKPEELKDEDISVEVISVDDVAVVGVVTPAASTVLKEYFGNKQNLIDAFEYLIAKNPNLTGAILDMIENNCGQIKYSAQKILNLAEIINESNFDSISKLIKNEHLLLKTDEKGNIVRNDYQKVLDLIKSNPSYEKEILDAFSNGSVCFENGEIHLKAKIDDKYYIQQRLPLALTFKKEIKSIDELFNAPFISVEEKAMMKELYQTIEKLGYKDYIDKNPDLFRCLAQSSELKETDNSTTRNSNYILMNHYINMDKDFFKILEYTYEQFKAGKISDEIQECIVDRRDSYTPYNWFMYIDNLEKVPAEIDRIQKSVIIDSLQKAQKLRDFINTQSIPTDIQVFRTEDVALFKQIKVGNETLFDILQNPERITEALDILNNGNSVLEYDNFVGTSFNKKQWIEDFEQGSNDIMLIEINVPKNSKGLFLDAAGRDSDGYMSFDHEAEFLLQTETKLKITGAEFKDGKLRLKADVIQASTGNGNIQAPNGALEAKSTNPAVNITPRLKGEVYSREFKEEGMRLNTPESIDAELREAEANPNAPKENLEALSIVASGKTSEILTQRYSEMAKILDEIHVTYAKELQQLETKFGNNPEQFAKHFMSFLAEKIGVSGCEPEIVFTKTEGDGAYNWETGQIYISDKLKSCKDIKTMIAHEFIHTLQFGNVLSTYGKDGVTELYMKHNNGKAIEDLTKNYVRNEFGVEIEELGLTKDEIIALQKNVAEAYADRCLASGANPRLLKYAQEHPVEKGSLNSYMGRLHLDNLIKPEEFDTEAYYRSTNESEAYYLGNGQITGRRASGESAQNIDAGTSQRASGITLPMGKLEAENPSLAEKLKNAAAKFNYELSRNLNRVQRGVNYVKEKAAGIQDKSRRIGKGLSWAYDYATLNLKLKKAGVKDNYYRKDIIKEIQNSQFESKEIYNSVINSIKTLKEMNVAEHTIGNVLISTTSAGENNVRVFNQNSVAIIEELVKLRELCGSEWKKNTASILLNIDADNSMNLAKLKEYTATMQEGYTFENTKHMISYGIKGENGRKIFKEILNSPAVLEKSDNYTSPEFIACQYYSACTNSKGEFIGKNWEYLQQLYSVGIKNPEKILNVIKNDNNEITQANIDTLMKQFETNAKDVNYYDYADRLKNCLNKDGLIDLSRMGDVNTLSRIARGLDITYFQNKDGSYNKEAIAQLQKLQDAGFRDKSSEINNILAAARRNAAAAKEEGVILSPETIDIAIELKNKGIEETLIGNILENCSKKDGHIDVEMLNTFEPVAKLLTMDDGYALGEWLFPILKSAGNPEIKENIIKNVQRLLEGGYNLIDICQSGIITNRGTVSDAVIDAAIKLKQENFTENLRENLEKVRMEDGSLNEESFNFLLRLKEEGFEVYRCADIIKLCTRDNGEFISENTQIVLNLIKEYNNSKYTGDSPYHLVEILVNASADKAGVIREDILKENQSKLDNLFNKLDAEDQPLFSSYLEQAVTKDGVFDDNVFTKINELKNIDDGVIDPNYHKSLHNFIDACRNEDGSFNLEAYNDGIKLVQKYGMNKWAASFAIPVYREFKHLENKNFVYDLSLQEKRSLQSKLLQYNQNLDQLKKLKGIIKSELLPTTDAEYSTLMKQLSQSLGETDLRLDIPALDRLNSDISSLYESEVTKPAEEVSLKENYDVLLKRIQSKMSGLSESEKRKIYDYFGFTVKNDKISGFPSTFGKNIEYTDITNSFSRKVVDAVTRVIDEFNANNSINVKGNPELSSLLTSISKNVPEILNKFSNSQKAAETVNLLNSIANSPDFAKLGESDKTVLILAALLKDSNAGNLQESAYTIFNITAKLNLSARDREKLYKLLIIPDLITNYENANPNKIIQRFSRMDNYKSNEKEEALDILAFSIKEDNVDKLAYLLYSSGNNGIMSNNLKTTLQDRIFEITKDDFVLPQTSAETLSASKGSVMTIQGYNVEVIEASSIPGFYAYVHTPEAGACNHSSRVTKFSNFEEFKNVDNNSVICASFVSADKSATWQKHGFLFKIKSGHEYVGMGHDMFSLCKNTTEMLAEYYRNIGLKAFSGKGYKFSHRTFIATQLKNNLHVSQNKYSDLIKSRNELTNSLKELSPESNEYRTIKNKIAEIDKEIRTIDEDYVQRLNRIKTQISSEQYSLDDIRSVDPEFAAAYEEFLARDNTGHKYGKQALLRNDYWNEVLVGNPEIEAIYTKDLKSLPEEYLQLAQEKGIKIILLK